jgi:hypothetical protein
MGIRTEELPYSCQLPYETLRVVAVAPEECRVQHGNMTFIKLLPGSFPGRGNYCFFSARRPVPPWLPPNLLSSGYRGLFPPVE